MTQNYSENVYHFGSYCAILDVINNNFKMILARSWIIILNVFVSTSAIKLVLFQVDLITPSQIIWTKKNLGKNHRCLHTLIVFSLIRVKTYDWPLLYTGLKENPSKNLCYFRFSLHFLWKPTNQKFKAKLVNMKYQKEK